MTRWSFTSESVTEGHPDKIADQISDAILDALLEKDPACRVACEALVTTGLALVAGEITTDAYVEIPRIVRQTICDIGYDGSTSGYDGRTCAVLVAIDEQSVDIAQGVNDSEEFRSGGGDGDGLDRQGAGDQGMMFGYACDETDVAMPLPIHLAHRLAERHAEVRRAGTIPYLGPDAKTLVTLEYENGKPIRVESVLVSTQHRDGIDRDSMIRPDVIEQVISPVIDDCLADSEVEADGYEIHVNPHRSFRHRRSGGRHRSHRPQDHRGHLRRHGPSRGRCLLGQGPVQGRSFRRLRRPLGGQEHRGGRGGVALRGPDRLRHRPSLTGVGTGRNVRDRDGGPSPDRGRGRHRVRSSTEGDQT